MIPVPTHLTEYEDIQKYLFEYVQSQAQQIADERKKEAYFARLHEKATEDTGETLSNTDALIQRLLPYASNKLKGQLEGESGSKTAGRATRFKATQETVARAKELYQQLGSYGKVAKALGTTYPTARAAVEGKYDNKL